MPRFTQQQFDDALAAMIRSTAESGGARCRVVARDLHRAVVGGSQPNRMPMACNAMWKLAEELPHTVVRQTPSGQSSSLEIEYVVGPADTSAAPAPRRREREPPRAATSPPGHQAGARLTRKEVEKLVAADESLQARDLSGADLTKASLMDADLRLANLCDAILRRVELICADLTGADLMRADLTGANCGAADFTEANLRNATLVRCDLTDADLTRADLTDADLTGANLHRAEVAGAVLVGVKLDRVTTLSGQQRSATRTEAELRQAGAITASPEDEKRALVGCTVVAVVVVAAALLLWWLP